MLQPTGVLKQNQLLTVLRDLFPSEKILENVKKKSALKYSTGSYMELDLWLPKYRLAFEFQDPYHYVTTWFSHKAVDTIKVKDNIKKERAQQMGINLVVVPCWWDGNINSLAATIKFQQPDIFLPTMAHIDSCIPLNTQSGFFKNAELPDVGELMLASFPSQFQFDQENISNNWWMGEKYDGIRFCWNSNRNKIYSRHGKHISVLSSIHSVLPGTIMLDGEFWFGRGAYILTYSLFMSMLDTVKWDLLRMITFDIPSSYDFQVTEFEKRYSMLLDSVDPHHPFLTVAPRIEIRDKKHLNKAVHAIINDEGEGLILSKKFSPYLNGRSPNLLKLKTAQEDKEGIVTHVVDHNSVHLKLADGSNIEVLSENILIPTPAIGDIVTFSFETHSRRELPQNPKIFRVRNDLSWDDVVQNFVKEQKFLNDTSKFSHGFKSQPIGHWSIKNMQLFLENFAKNRRMDPHIPETWYNISLESIRKTKIGRAILHKIKGGFFHILKTLFPELNLVKEWWKDKETRRRVMEVYARQRSLDPHQPSHWYSIPKNSILSFVGPRRVIQCYDSVVDALLDLFPEIGLKKSKFPGYSIVTHNRREFFEKVARDNSLDPSLPSNWYSFPRHTILGSPGARKILSFHRYSISQALMDLFPEIGLDRTKLYDAWDTLKMRRKFFEEYARVSKFNPWSADSWYSHSRKQIMRFKGAKEVMMYHNNSVATALIDLFPEVVFDKSKFFQSTVVWQIDTRRNFFIDFATKNGFEPNSPHNWYCISPDLIKAQEHGSIILSHYNNNLSAALIELFPDIGLNKAEFQRPVLWKDQENRRRFFENFASDNGFDPKVSSNWYSCSRDSIMAVKGAHSVIMYHSFSISQALMDLFPDIGLSKTMLFHFGKSSMNDFSNRKMFFERYATDNTFNPLIPEHWYLQSRSSITATKGCRDVLLYHKNSLATALMDLFPEIGLERSKLRANNWK